MDFRFNRPPGLVASGDRYLPHLSEELGHFLAKVQRSFQRDTLFLPHRELEELAGVLVEFAEDVHNGIGIWNSLERYNADLFGTPLPFVMERGDHSESQPINEFRVRHLLWVLFSVLRPQLILSPTHPDLIELAAVTSAFLSKRFAKIPRSSSVKKFLGGPNRFGWDVKRKLVWLGTHSYLFRDSFRNYVDAHGGEADIPVVDDFICQATTAWSGLGVVDILAKVLDIPEGRQSELRGWYERHQAYYRILEAKDESLEVINLINDKPYTVRMPSDGNPFETEMIVFGSLVPWNGEWYWSGQQRTLKNVTAGTLQELLSAFRRKLPDVTYRYCPDLAEQAKQANDREYRRFVETHGSDLVIYPDGLSMAADYQKHLRQSWQSKPKETIDRAVEKHKLKGPGPDMNFPSDILNCESGVGVYYNPEEGIDIMTGFNNVVSGIEKKGQDLTEDQENAIRSFIRLDAISPSFVRRLIKERGGYESILAAFLIPTDSQNSLDYLLRVNKGAYYRRRYPHIALV